VSACSNRLARMLQSRRRSGKGSQAIVRARAIRAFGLATTTLHGRLSADGGLDFVTLKSAAPSAAIVVPVVLSAPFRQYKHYWVSVCDRSIKIA